MKVKLALYDSSTKVDDFVLDDVSCVIGRSEDADITLHDRWVSRRHCRVDLRDGVVVVHDLGSRHGTLVNDRPIVESALLPGDTLCVGLSKLVADYDCEGHSLASG